MFELAPPGTETPLMDNFEGMIDSKQNMKVDKMVSIAIDGFKKDKWEIRPGISNVLKTMSRVAPNLILSFMNKSLEKAKAKNK